MDILQTDIYLIQNIIPRSSLLPTMHSSFILLDIPRSILHSYYFYVHYILDKQIE